MLDRHLVVPLGLVALLGCTPRPTADLQPPTTVTPAVRSPETSGDSELAEANKARWIDLSIEKEFGCAVERTGSVFCWGRGPSAEMQLRELATQPKLETKSYGARRWGPASRVELIHDARKVSTASGLACAIVEDGRVRCWGAIRWGTQHVFDVPGIAGAVDLEVGDSQSCVTLDTGALHCWSADDFGVPRHRLDDVLEVVIGDSLACGLTTQGDVLCWGQGVENWYRYNPGNLGSPASGAEQEFPDTLEIGRFRGAVDLALSGWNSLCVLRGDGKVVCSEDDMFKVLRKEDLHIREVEGTQGIESFESSRHHSCGRTVDESALCWGRNTYGQLGDGRSISRDHAAPIVGLDGVTMLSVAEDFTCALTRADEIACWGFDRGESLGHEDIHVHTIEGLRASSIAAADHTTCAVDLDKTIHCWGSDQQLQQIGIVGVTNPAIVVPQASGELVDLDAGRESCLLLSSGTLQCGTWTTNPASKLTFIPSRTSTDVLAIAGAKPPACTITGSGRKAQLNCGATLAQVEPERGIRSPFDVSASHMRGCVAHRGGKVSCFAEYYHWGDQPRLNREFIQIPGISDATAVTSASAHDCALSKDGRVRCWTGRVKTEWNDETRVITRMHYQSSKPQDLGLEQIVQIVAGSQHHCALSKLGKVTCWDDGPFNKTIAWQPTPELGSDIVELAAGTGHTCARDQAGKVTCWGDDVWGQLGRVPSRVYLTPTPMKID